MKEKQPFMVLLIDKNIHDADLVQQASTTYDIDQLRLLQVNDLESALESLSQGRIDVVLWDSSVKDEPASGTALRIHAQALQVPIVMLDAIDSETTLFKGDRVNLQQCLLKQPVNESKLLESIQCAIDQQQLHIALAQQTRELQCCEARFHNLEIVYEFSRQLGYTLNYEELVRLMLDHLDVVVPHDVSASVLITGEVCNLSIQQNCLLTSEVQQEIQQRLFKTFTRIKGNNISFQGERCSLNLLDSKLFDENKPPMTRLGSCFQVPIVTADTNEVVGLLFVGAEAEETFTEEQVRLLYTIANQASVSIQRLRKLLAAEQQHLENLVANLPEGVLLLDADCRIIVANPAAWKYLAIMLNEVSGNKLTHLGEQAIEVFLAPPPPGKFCHEVILEGVVFEIVAQELPAKVASQSQNWLLVIRDVTERQKAEENLRVRDRAVLASSNGIIIADARLPDLPIIYVNPAFESITGYTAAEVIGKNCRFLQGAETNQLALEELRIALRQGKDCSVILHNYRKDGSPFWNELNISPIYDTNGAITHFVGIQTDISERKKTEEQLRYHAFYDNLTKLPNRAFFMNRLIEVIKLSEQPNYNFFAVLFLDLDRFKNINDSLGHIVGDELLVTIAQRLENSLRSQDTVARLGGDEFAILLENIQSMTEVTQIANRIHQALSLPIYLEGQEVFTTASIGIVMASGKSHPDYSQYDKPEDLLRDADIALYQAKALGKARYEVFDKKMHAYAVKLLQLENDLRRAINSEEFQLYYQPIINLSTKQVTGFEALIRWQHPEKGMVSPVDFIPIAEETGVIVEIGWWTLFKACEQLCQWQNKFPLNPPLSMSINLSGKQFSQGALVDKVAWVLQETGLPPESLRLEITESALMENVESTLKRLWELRELGVKLYMDDFGTGYSSLSYLRKFPIDVLKIDRSFVMQMNVDNESREIVRTVVGLAHNLGMEAIAEGVETAEQLNQLKLLDCEYGQGYYFAKPLQAEAAEELLTKSLLSDSTIFLV